MSITGEIPKIDFKKEIQKLKRRKTYYVIATSLIIVFVIGLLNLPIPSLVVCIGVPVYFILYCLFKISGIKKKIRNFEYLEEKRQEEEYRKKYGRSSRADFDRIFMGTIFEMYQRYSRESNDPLFKKILDDFMREQAQQHGHSSSTSFTPPASQITIAYRLLKLSRTDSEETIKSRYRELAKKYHPDKWSTGTQKEKETADRNFKKLNNAYDLIKRDKGIN